MIKILLVAIVVLTACGSGTNTTTDAPKAIDAPPPTVVMVACPMTPAATITTSDIVFNFSPPSTMITQGQIIQFTMSPAHNVAPGHVGGGPAAISDPGTSVGFGMTKCLMFTQTGTFGFHCVPHVFDGTVIVQ